MVFSNLEIDSMFLENIKKQGFETMFPVQREAIPLALQGNDLVVQAKTGSGKTLAFAIPICERIDTGRKEVQAIVLVPTRELAVQVQEEFDKLTQGTRLRSVPVYGGSSINRQIQGIRGGSQIIVGTPGRVIDLIQRNELHLDGVSVAVLDEGDRMFDMGFKDDIEYILSRTPASKQSMLFSATVPTEIQYLIDRNFRTPKEIRVGDTSTDVTQVQQVYVDCDFKARFNKLCNYLVQEKIAQTIIFCNAKHECEKLARNLKRYDFKTMSLHGDLSQNQRDDAMDAFKAGKVQILCATDIAARGLDIDGVSHVINYDVPKETNNYVHRIGRTARAGRTGVAITFLMPEGWEFFQRITGDLKLDIKPIDVPIAKEYFFRREQDGGPRGPRRGGPQRGGFSRSGPSRGGPRGGSGRGNSTETSNHFNRNRHYLGI